MGRKGGGGGTAGGGRSGRKGNITFNRVIPKFLQNIQAQNATDTAKVRQSIEHQKDKRLSQQSRKSHPGQEPTSSEVIAELEKEGFRVLQVADESASGDKAENPGTEMKDAERQNVGSFQRPSNGRKVVAHGAVEKTKARRVRPSNAFGISNNQRLSFVEEESGSDQSD